MMVDPVDPRMLAAQLDPTVGPAGVGQSGAPKQTQLPPPGQPTFAEILSQTTAQITNVENNIPDAGAAQSASDVESLSKQLDDIHQMTLQAAAVIADLGERIVSPEEPDGAKG